MLAFEVRGGSPAGTAFAEGCRVARIALSLGGPETLITHPATIASRYTPSERAELGITDGLVRLSVGLEHADDLQADLAQALEPLHLSCAPHARDDRGGALPAGGGASGRSSSEERRVEKEGVR